MEGCSRRWSANEQQQLFQRYFDSLPALCPVCGFGTRFRMHYTSELVLLSAGCDGCGNTALLFFGGIIALPLQTPNPEQHQL